MSFKVFPRLTLFAADLINLGYYAEDEEVTERVIDKLERIFPFDNIITDIDTAENYYEETREYPERETHYELYEENGEKYLREVYEDGTEVEEEEPLYEVDDFPEWQEAIMLPSKEAKMITGGGEFNTMCTLNLRLYGIRKKGAENNDFLLLKIERHYI